MILIAYSSAKYAVARLTGIGSMHSPPFFKRRLTLKMPGPEPTEVVIAFADHLRHGLMNIAALREEIGWRGFLVPELNSGWVQELGST